jgi:hypothetical protein
VGSTTRKIGYYQQYVSGTCTRHRLLKMRWDVAEVVAWMWPHTMFDDHTKPHYGVTVPQLALLLIWLVSLLLWLTQLRKGLLFKWISSAHHNSTPPDVIVHTTGDTPAGDGEPGDKAPLLQTGGESAAPAVKKPREEHVPTHEHFLRSVLILGLILFYFYLCDYRKVRDTPPLS